MNPKFQNIRLIITYRNKDSIENENKIRIREYIHYFISIIVINNVDYSYLNQSGALTAP